MPNLNRFVHYACGFVDFEGKTTSDIPYLMSDFVKFCDSYTKIKDYYLIAHDETDCLHIHFIFYSISQVQLMTYFNKMREYFVNTKRYCRDENGISIEKCININKMLEYDVHQDKDSISKGKKRYEIDDFVTNVEIETIDTMIHSKKGVLDAFYLRDAVLDCQTDFDLMVYLSLPVYHRYKNEIEILRSMRASLMLQRENEKKEKEDNALPF